jgi:hypothetical protein
MSRKKQEAFVEQPQEENDAVQPSQLTLHLAEDGTIDWTASDQSAFIHTITNDSTTLEIIGAAVEDQGPTVADATVLAAVNTIMGVEAIAISTLGPRVAPVLKEVKLPVALKACLVTKEEIEPILEPAKRIIVKYTPAAWLEYQDFAVVLEHIGKLSGEKFAQCIALGVAIQNQRKVQEVQPGQQPVNGKEQIVETKTP